MCFYIRRRTVLAELGARWTSARELDATSTRRATSRADRRAIVIASIFHLLQRVATDGNAPIPRTLTSR